jgi:pre-mRNA-splicing factor ATP-dependent RNA helicase DHX38/PRP16
MSSSPNDTGHHDDFVHHIAIKVSRELNTINPNDLLARRVIDIATDKTLSAFTSGARTYFYNTYVDVV